MNTGTQTGGNARTIGSMTLIPNRQYVASMWVKTDSNYECDALLLNLIDGAGRSLNYAYISGITGIEANTDWTQVSFTFNSIEATSVNVYAGN